MPLPWSIQYECGSQILMLRLISGSVTVLNEERWFHIFVVVASILGGSHVSIVVSSNLMKGRSQVIGSLWALLPVATEFSLGWSLYN